MSEYPEKKEDEEEPKGITQEELIQQLEAQTNYYDKLPQHEKFSFVTNADLCYFMLLVLNILKKGVK